MFDLDPASWASLVAQLVRASVPSAQCCGFKSHLRQLIFIFSLLRVSFFLSFCLSFFRGVYSLITTPHSKRHLFPHILFPAKPKNSTSSFKYDLIMMIFICHKWFHWTKKMDGVNISHYLLLCMAHAWYYGTRLLSWWRYIGTCMGLLWYTYMLMETNHIDESCVLLSGHVIHIPSQ